MNRLLLARFLSSYCLVFVLAAASSAAVAQSVGSESVDAKAGAIEGDTEIAFTETQFDVLREGYVTLEWNSVDGAVRYELLDSLGSVAYSGAMPKAFLSGLPDGRYEYLVQAIGESDQILAISTSAAELNVQHWSMPLFLSLFFVGLIVVLAVAAVLLMGARGGISPSSLGGPSSGTDAQGSNGTLSRDIGPESPGQREVAS